MRAPVHGHGQPAAGDRNGGRPQRHKRKRKPLRHIRLQKGPSAALHREQKGPRKNERRVRRNPHIRGCLSEVENVLYLEGRRKKYQKGKGRKKERCEETDKA